MRFLRYRVNRGVRTVLKKGQITRAIVKVPKREITGTGSVGAKRSEK